MTKLHDRGTLYHHRRAEAIRRLDRCSMPAGFRSHPRPQPLLPWSGMLV